MSANHDIVIGYVSSPTGCWRLVIGVCRARHLEYLCCILIDRVWCDMNHLKHCCSAKFENFLLAYIDAYAATVAACPNCRQAVYSLE